MGSQHSVSDTSEVSLMSSNHINYDTNLSRKILFMYDANTFTDARIADLFSNAIYKKRLNGLDLYSITGLDYCITCVYSNIAPEQRDYYYHKLIEKRHKLYDKAIVIFDLGSTKSFEHACRLMLKAYMKMPIHLIGIDFGKKRKVLYSDADKEASIADASYSEITATDLESCI